jgi:hypothetical protein
MQPYAIRYVKVLTLARFGLVLGAVTALPFGFVMSVVGMVAVGMARRFLEGWRDVSLAVLGQQFRFDFVQLLGLDGLLRMLQTLDDGRLMLALACLLGPSLAAGLMLALTAALAGMTYNLVAGVTGGVEVQLEVPGLPPGGPTQVIPTSVTPPVAWLIPSGDGPAVPLTREVTLIGRAPGCDIRLEAPGLAERHAEVRQEGGRFVIYDLGSATGVWVNGRRVVQANLLKDGFVVSLSGIEYVFRTSGGMSRG